MPKTAKTSSCNYTAISGQDAPLLMEGDQVAFFLENTVRGPQASDVTRLN
jgi:cold shock CspA family protein